MHFQPLYICLLVIILSSCVNTKKEIKKIQELESIITEHRHSINNLEIGSLETILNLAQLNILELEQMRLDSLSFELIYLDYKLYLNLIHDINKSIQLMENIHKDITINTNQLENLKYDCLNSNYRIKKFEEYLNNESKYIQNTSNQIKAIVNKIKLEIEDFYSLNKKIEKIINK